MREKRIRGQDKSEPLFDYKLDIFSPDEPFVVDASEIPSEVIAKYASGAKRQASYYARTVKLLKAPDADIPKPGNTSDADPLNPEIFIGHHRRMEREERRMQLLERQQLVLAATKVRQQIETLQRPDWRTRIDKIVKIDDDDDDEVVIRKRDLAIKEMSIFLEKFEENNKRNNRRESRSEKPKSDNKPKKPDAKRPSKPAPKPKPMMVSYEDFLDPPKPTISIRPFAFGGMLPQRKFPPQDYQLPSFLILETESYDLMERLRKRRRDMKIKDE